MSKNPRLPVKNRLLKSATGQDRACVAVPANKQMTFEYTVGLSRPSLTPSSLRLQLNFPEVLFQIMEGLTKYLSILELLSEDVNVHSVRNNFKRLVLGGWWIF